MNTSDKAASKASSVPAQEKPLCRPFSHQVLIAAVAGALLIGHFRPSIGADLTLPGDGSIRPITMSFSVPVLLLLLTGAIGAAASPFRPGPGTALLRRREA